MNTGLSVRVDWMHALLLLLLAATGFALFIFFVSRSVRFIALVAVAILAAMVIAIFGGFEI